VIQTCVCQEESVKEFQVKAVFDLPREQPLGIDGELDLERVIGSWSRPLRQATGPKLAFVSFESTVG